MTARTTDREVRSQHSRATANGIPGGKSHPTGEVEPRKPLAKVR